MGTIEYLSQYEQVGNCPTELKGFRRTQLADMFRRLGFRVGAEIGVDMGTNARRLCRRNPNARLYCIDPWEEYETRRGGDQEHRDRCFSMAIEALRHSNVAFIRQRSLDAVRWFGDKSLDFVYIDGDHRYESIGKDLPAWSRKVRVGGIVSGDDYYSESPGVVRAVEEYVKENAIQQWFITDTSRPSSYFWVKQ